MNQGSAIDRVSLAPGFSRVLSRGEFSNRFNGFRLIIVKAAEAAGISSRFYYTGLKPGANERGRSLGGFS
jgi:hypothetical protein